MLINKGTKFEVEVPEGSDWIVFDDQCILAHPDFEPQIVKDGKLVPLRPQIPIASNAQIWIYV